MMSDKNKSYILFGVVFLVLLIDQASKFWVKTHMTIGQDIYPFGVNWAIIHFVENNGMAFGLSFGGSYGKLALSLFRILAVFLLAFYLRWLLRERASTILLVGFGLIMAGALGNIIDSAFYGVFFSESTFHGMPAVFLPESGGYAGFLHGKVVDMLYFPVVQGYFPEWMPFWSGRPFVFFRPVFNIADVAITSGVILILVLHLFFAKYVHPLSEIRSSEKGNKEHVPVLETVTSSYPLEDAQTTATDADADPEKTEINPGG